MRDTALWQVTTGRLFDWLPLQALWVVLIAIGLWFILNRHRFGEALLFLGDNAEVARVMNKGALDARTKAEGYQQQVRAAVGLAAV